jgi:hypothetical protein
VIDFRYHLVSIVAVFLALGLGLLLGSTELKPYLLRGLENTSKAQKREIDSLIGTQRQLTLEINRNQQFAQAAERQLLGQVLAGQHVVLVAAPGAPSQVVTGISQLLATYSGAAVTGEIQLQPSMLDISPSTQHRLSALAQQLAPNVVVPGESPAAQAGQALGSAILTRDGPGQPVAGQPDSLAQAVLNGFEARGFVSTVSGRPSEHATLAVVVVPSTPASTRDSNPQSQALVTLAQEFQQADKGTVVAGSAAGAGPGSAIDVMRKGRAGTMSSVDSADTVIGQIVAVQALAKQLSGVSGSYGSLATAGQAAPSPAPTPSTSESGTPVASALATHGPPARGKR